MKKLYFAVILVFSFQLIQAQFIGDTEITDIQEQYLLVKVFNNLSINNIGFTASVEYEPKTMDGFRRLSNLRESPGGELVSFQSKMAAINFFYEKGYELFQVLSDEEGNAQSFILQRKEG